MLIVAMHAKLLYKLQFFLSFFLSLQLLLSSLFFFIKMIFNKIQVRYASVLASLPPSPYSSSHCIHQLQESIITPASLPLTAASNNAFNPNYIPRNTKERLALNDLYKVLDNSKSMTRIIQNKYLLNEEISKEEELSLEELLDEQCRMIQMIKKFKK
jgi:hypothetical protein